MVQVLSQICASSGAANYQREIRQFLWSHRSEKETDMVIISGEEAFKVHRAVILPVSSHLMHLLPPSCSCCKTTIFLPPFPSHVMAAALKMLYTGETATRQEYQVQVEEVFAFLKIKADIQNVSEEHIFDKNVQDIDSSIINEDEEIESNGDEESSFCKAIQSQAKRDENYNSETTQDMKIYVTQYHKNGHSYNLNEDTGIFYGNSTQNGQDITPTHPNMYSFCLNEHTGLFYSGNKDDETVKANKNPVKIKKNYLFNHGNENIAKIDDNHNNTTRDERNKLEATENMIMGDNNIDETSLEENYEIDDNNEYESFKNNQREVRSRCPKRRYLTTLDYFDSGEQQSSSHSPTAKPKKQRKSRKKISSKVKENQGDNIIEHESYSEGDAENGQVSFKNKERIVQKQYIKIMKVKTLSESTVEILNENKQDQRRHQQAKSRPLHKCEHCDYEVVNKQNLRMHIDAEHKGIRYYCDQCPYEAKAKRDVQRHVKSIHDAIKHKCDQCPYEAKAKRSIRRHVESIHKGIRFKCNECDYEAKTRKDVQRHVKSVHDGFMYKCNQCPYEAKAKRSVQGHVESIHKGIRFNCDKCEYEAKSRRDVQRHVKSNHDGIMYKCDQCPYEAKAKKSVQNHKKFIHEGFMYKCDQCPYEAKAKISVQMHVESIHVGIRFKCSECDYEAKDRKDVQRHTKSTHLEDMMDFVLNETGAITKERESGI